MARHNTGKNTERGKDRTCTRRKIRALKFASPALDIPALERELHSVTPFGLDYNRRSFGGAA